MKFGNYDSLKTLVTTALDKTTGETKVAVLSVTNDHAKILIGPVTFEMKVDDMESTVAAGSVLTFNVETGVITHHEAQAQASAPTATAAVAAKPGARKSSSSPTRGNFFD